MMDTSQQQRLLTSTEAAAYLRASVQTLAHWRCRGDGPVYLKRRGRILYRQADLDIWLNTTVRTSTSDDTVRRSTVVPLRGQSRG